MRLDRLVALSTPKIEAGGAVLLRFVSKQQRLINLDDPSTDNTIRSPSHRPSFDMHSYAPATNTVGGTENRANIGDLLVRPKACDCELQSEVWLPF